MTAFTRAAPCHAILFDLDGVVIDTQADVVRFWLTLATEHGLTISDTQFVQDVFGIPAFDTVARLFPMLTAADHPWLLDRIERYERELTYVAMPGVITLLDALRDAGVPTALVTSANRAKVEIVMRQLALAPRFTRLVTVDDIARGKPAPDAYLAGAALLGVSAARCLVFEDAVSGVQSGVAAGAACIGVQATPAVVDALVQAGASHVIPDFTGVRVQHDSAGLTLAVAPALALPLQSRPTA